MSARHPLLDELERYIAVKQSRIGDPPRGCPILFAIEIGSAIGALEGVGIEGVVDIGGEPVRIGRGSEGE